MKKIALFLSILLFSFYGMAQQVEYQTFIYTSNDLADEITKLCKEREMREAEAGVRLPYLEKLFNASKESVKGIASGYVTSFIDLGVNAIASLVTRNSRLKQEWEDMVQAENVYKTTLGTVSEVNDFYDNISFDGAMDPAGMRFDGIGCLRKEGQDTVFYISCHIDRSKIDRIINHSKFELALDTLIISPMHSNLPNSPLDLPFSFAERQNFTLSMDMTLTSSWMNEIVMLQKDQVLGEFNITIPVDPSMLDNDGFLRYVRKKNEAPAYKVVGESFIIPRSYMGYRGKDGRYKNSWGTGEYKLSIVLKETCEVTDAYRENWKKDRKRRKKMQPKEDFMDATWQMISNQRWDELSQSWIITTLQAPAKIITKDVIDKLGLEPEAKQAKLMK